MVQAAYSQHILICKMKAVVTSQQGSSRGLVFFAYSVPGSLLTSYSVIVINTLRVFVKSREGESRDWGTNWKCELASCLDSALCASVVCVSLMKNTSPSSLYAAVCAFTYSGSAFESLGLQALDCHWWQRLPMVPSWVLNWPLIPRAREQQCFLRTWAGTVQSCCLKKSTG